MKIHHIGYAVKDLEDSVGEFEKLGYKKVKNIVIDKKRKVKIQFVENGEGLIELISPLHNESPITNILKKQGNSPYHICYKTDNIDYEIDKLINDKFVVITQLSEAPALDDRKVVFLYKRNVGLIELLENESQKLC
jgi:methylmalonyl-CoA/ethylmalonyl-CoA epimerase